MNISPANALGPKKKQALIALIVNPLSSDHSGGERFAELTHLPLDKIAAILADNIFKLIFLNEDGRILIQISLQFVQLVQEMVWCQTGKIFLVKLKLNLPLGKWNYSEINGVGNFLGK